MKPNQRTNEREIQNLRRYSGRRGSGRCGSAVTFTIPSSSQARSPRDSSLAIGPPDPRRKAHERSDIWRSLSPKTRYQTGITNYWSKMLKDRKPPSPLVHGTRAAVPRFRDMLDSGWSYQVATENQNRRGVDLAADHWRDDAAMTSSRPAAPRLASVNACRGESRMMWRSDKTAPRMPLLQPQLNGIAWN